MRPPKGRGRLGAILACLALAACSIPKEINPVEIYREVSGEAAAGRERPPGLDQPYPNLGTIPKRPDRPTQPFMDSVTSALATDREQSREPLPDRDQPAPPAAAVSPGTPPVPAGPPPPPALAAAAPVPWVAPPQAGAPPGQPAPVAPQPGLVPQAPPPDLLGPAPAR